MQRKSCRQKHWSAHSNGSMPDGTERIQDRGRGSSVFALFFFKLRGCNSGPDIR
ncbi:hypothetical protein HPP92_024643 [Vanilla planifolia]|uniref:Uncharacterized protein n=1 Tax=Vanilla planifolia TaxID=51239 RepID=A0A835UDG5_VANPL|nr:hypothetical protein HPP92_024643 [Vanilla planifolia]